MIKPGTTSSGTCHSHQALLCKLCKLSESMAERVKESGLWISTCFSHVLSVLRMMKFLTILLVFFHLPHLSIGATNSCYDSNGRAQKCVPEFQNAAFNLTVEATNTCGLTGPQEYCLQTGVTGARKSCGHICDAMSPRDRHPSNFMTDFNNQNNWTWWQSETMLERRKEWWRESKQQIVNLTLSLGKI